MRILLIAPNDPTINAIPEIRAISSKHHATILNGNVTLQTIDQYVRQGYNIIHFAGHSNEEYVELSDGVKMEADDLVRFANMAGATLIFFNSCEAAKLAAYAVGHGIQYAIASTIKLVDSTDPNHSEAWKFPSAFYSALDNGKWRNIYMAFKAADSGDGEYAFLISPTQHMDWANQLSELRFKLQDAILVHPRTLFLVATLTIITLFAFSLILFALSGRTIF